MADSNTKTISGAFATREAADRAIEHLVQELGLDRTDIFVEPQSEDNSAGTSRSGSDAAQYLQEGSVFPPALEGSILVSADVEGQKLDDVEAKLRDLGASDIQRR